MTNLCKNEWCALTLINNRKVTWKNYTCSFYNFNTIHFWSYLKQMKQTDFTFKPSHQLIFETTIYLNDDTAARSVLCIGLNPENKFKIYARLERKSINDCLMLTLNELENLVHKEKENIFSEKSIEGSNIGKRFVIYAKQSQGAEIHSYDDGRHILLDICSLKRLIRAREFINRNIHSLQSNVLKCQKFFILLLNNFCLGKTINEACETVWTDLKWVFFESIVNLKCVCSDENFTSEIALKCESWFAVCVPWFLKTMMLAEIERLASFKINWPHFAHYVSVEEMTRCGLYFTGIGDNVKCVFCNILLNNWQRGEKPIIKHYKYSPKCPFLNDFTKTSNISSVGDREKIDKLLFFLLNWRANDSMNEVDSMDEVDDQ